MNAVFPGETCCIRNGIFSCKFPTFLAQLCCGTAQNTAYFNRVCLSLSAQHVRVAGKRRGDTANV